MHPANIELDRDRMVRIIFTDGSDQSQSIRAIPHNITFGRGAWWLEVTNVDTNQYTRIRMSRITLFQKAS